MSAQTVTIVEQTPRHVLVRVQPDKIDESNLAGLRSETAAAGAAAPDLPVILDLSRVGFLPSMSLGGLLQLAQLFKSRKQRFVLVGLQADVREMVVLTRLDRVFEILSDADAVTGLSR
jgi:anti-anti-sigma factor